MYYAICNMHYRRVVPPTPGYACAEGTESVPRETNEGGGGLAILGGKQGRSLLGLPRIEACEGFLKFSALESNGIHRYVQLWLYDHVHVHVGGSVVPKRESRLPKGDMR